MTITMTSPCHGSNCAFNAQEQERRNQQKSIKTFQSLLLLHLQLILLIPTTSTIIIPLSTIFKNQETRFNYLKIKSPELMGFLIFILLFVTITSAQNNNIISPGSSLYASNPNITWTSPNNLVSLSFIPATSSSQNTFIAAILYDGITIWQPITTAVDSTAEFRFLSSGNLILTNQTNHNFWETNTDGMNVTHAEIQDSGNLVLSSSKLNDSVSVWSTFDHPTDTIVPSQNFTTRNNLTSGVYSFNLVSSGNITLTWNHNIVYWNLGNSSFDVNLTSPTLSLQKIGILSISDPMLSSPAIMAYSSDYAEGNGDDIFRFLKLDSDGNLRIYSSNRNSKSPMVRWSAVLDQCQVFGYCGKSGICSYNDTSPVCGCASKNFDPIDPNDSRKGCKRKVELADCPSDVVMLELSHTQFLTYPPETTSQVFFIATAACKGNCLSDNNLCNASTSLSDGTGLCYIKTSDFISGYQSPALPSTSFFKVCGPVDLNPSSSFSNPGEYKGWRLPVWIVAVVVVSTLLALVMFELVIWWCCCKNSSKFGGLTAQYALLEYASGAPVQFSYKELNRATKGFKEKLGEGGFGVVYKGVLANRTVSAVKQLEGIEQGEKQFRMEVATISSTHHLNLVRLIGFCSEGRHRLLVYEFMKNGSLDKFLFTAEMGKLLSWENRFNILLGTARGITYLHEECRDCIVHCDIKPENILLDENYNAKVSDFGLAKLINPKDHRYRTLTSVRGTRGYLAPEWLANLPITSKSDVYSYGMVLLETVSGKRNFEVSEATNRKKFSVWAYEEYERGNVMGIVDKRVVGDQKEVNVEQLTRVIQVSFWCIQEQPSHRPTMGKVVQMLEGITEMEKPPAPKAFADGSFSSLSIVEASAPPPSSSSSSRHATTGISSYISAKNMDRASTSLRESQNNIP